MPRRSPFSLLNRGNSLSRYPDLANKGDVFGQRRITHLTLALLLVIFCAPVAADATGDMTIRIVNPPDAKTFIEACTIHSFDDLDMHIHPRVTLDNVADQTIIGVHVALTFFKHDSIDGDIVLGPPIMLAWPIRGDSVLAPRQSAEYNDPGVELLNTQYPSNEFVTCAVDAVKFEDGTIWRASAKGNVKP